MPVSPLGAISLRRLCSRPARTLLPSTCLRFASVIALLFSLAGALASGQSVATGDSFIARYQARVSATQNQQPHWITPLVTVTPRLEQEFRADFVRRSTTNGLHTWILGNGKGLEIIPARRIELLFNVPPFISHEGAAQTSDGFGDLSFNSKFRFFARNEEHGNAIVTGFFAASIPTGKNENGSCCAVVTPTLALGKGWGPIALTSTAGGSLPVTGAGHLGHTIGWNTAAQYHLASRGLGRFFWPEVESNASFFFGGANDGETTTYLTPGIIVGRIPLTHPQGDRPGRLGLTFGAGEQIAVTHFHRTNHNLVITVRMPF